MTISTVYIQELKTPEAKAMKYIAMNLGMNLRPGIAIRDKVSGDYRIPIDAVIPRKVVRRSGEAKVFVFSFENVGEIILDANLNRKAASSALDIDERISSLFWKIYSNIEKEILLAGRQKWGKLPWVHAYVRPMYSIITHILTKGYESVDILKRLEIWEYARVLMEDEYLSYNPRDVDSVIPANKLTMLHEVKYTREARGENLESHDPFEIAEIVVGDVFSRRFDQLIRDFNIRILSTYVDLTKTYYVDAVNVGEKIAVPQEELFQKYRTYVNRPIKEEKEISFATIVSELVAAQLLDREEDRITGNQALFDRLLCYREEILKGVEMF